MKSLKKVGFLMYFTVLFYLLFMKPVYAYIDPGTGSLIIQIVIGGLIGAGVGIKIFWKKIIGFFTKNKGS
jgi:hypothetical protein